MDECVTIHKDNTFYKRQSLLTVASDSHSSTFSQLEKQSGNIRTRKVWKHGGGELTSAEIRRFPLFLRHTPVGDCTSSEEVPDAWSLSPSDPIFRFSWTISGAEKEERKQREKKKDEGLSLTDGFRSVETQQLMTTAEDRKDRKTLLDTLDVQSRG